jgi:hypothetical protein
MKTIPRPRDPLAPESRGVIWSTAKPDVTAVLVLGAHIPGPDRTARRQPSGRRPRRRRP